MSGAPPRLFVSHADADRDVVELVVDLLKQGLGISSERIYCTALPETGITAGRQFVQSVRDQLANPAIVVLVLLSSNFYESPFSLNEVGAAWILERPERELLIYTIPPFSHKSLRGVILDRQANPLTTRAKLDELRRELSRKLQLAATNDDDWRVAVNKFLGSIGPKAYEVERRRVGIEYDVFVSTPMSSITSDDYTRIRNMGVQLAKAVEATEPKGGGPGFRAYYAAKNYPTKEDFDAEDEAVERDLGALRASEHFMLIYDREAPTSALFEAGMALAYIETQAQTAPTRARPPTPYAFERTSTYFHRDGVKLPFMMRKLARNFPHVREYEYKDEQSLLKTAARYPLPFKRWEAWNIDKV